MKTPWDGAAPHRPLQQPLRRPVEASRGPFCGAVLLTSKPLSPPSGSASVAQLDPAAALYSECLAARLRLLGPTHADTLLTAGNLAVVRDKRKEPKEALDMYAHAGHQ